MSSAERALSAVDDGPILKALYFGNAGGQQQLRQGSPSEGEFVGQIPTTHSASKRRFAARYMDDAAPARLDRAVHYKAYASRRLWPERSCSGAAKTQPRSHRAPI